jgi:DNA-directed RNA polymerase subunit E"
MAEKACKKCGMIYEGDKCPNCGSQEHVEEIKGRVVILDPENSEIAKNIKITKKGSYLIRSS